MQQFAESEQEAAEIMMSILSHSRKNVLPKPAERKVHDEALEAKQAHPTVSSRPSRKRKHPGPSSTVTVTSSHPATVRGLHAECDTPGFGGGEELLLLGSKIGPNEPRRSTSTVLFHSTSLTAPRGIQAGDKTMTNEKALDSASHRSGGSDVGISPVGLASKTGLGLSPGREGPEIRTTFSVQGKAFRWCRCSKPDCRRWRKLPRMCAFESLPPHWTCDLWEGGSCSLAEDDKLNQDLITLSNLVGQRIYDKERIDFCEHVKQYLWSIGLRLHKDALYVPIGGEPVDIYRLYREVTCLGGCDAVTAFPGRWGEVYQRISGKAMFPDAAYRLKRVYKQCLYLYEQHYHFGIRFVKGTSDAAPYVRPIAPSRRRALKSLLKAASKRLRFR